MVEATVQFQIYPAAWPRILHQTVWRTWLFIAYSDKRWLYYQFSLGECNFFYLGNERVKRCEVLGINRSLLSLRRLPVAHAMSQFSACLALRWTSWTNEWGGGGGGGVGGGLTWSEFLLVNDATTLSVNFWGWVAPVKLKWQDTWVSRTRSEVYCRLYTPGLYTLADRKQTHTKNSERHYAKCKTQWKITKRKAGLSRGLQSFRKTN